MLMRTEMGQFESFNEFERITKGLRNEHRVQQVPLDAYRRGTEFKAHLDLPGVDPDSIELTIEQDVLTVRATRNWMPVEGDQVQVSERAQGEFGRRLLLGKWLNRDDISATYENGVLTITIPIAEQAKPRKIEVIQEGGLAQAVEAAFGPLEEPVPAC
jgi:HSP20 family protein